MGRREGFHGWFELGRSGEKLRSTAGMGFQDLADAADERWFQGEMAHEARIEASRTARAEKKAADAAGKPLKKAALRELLEAASALGISLEKVPKRVQRRLFGSIVMEAKALSIDASELRRRRLVALKLGHGDEAILKARRLDGAIGAGPLGRKPKTTSATVWGAPPPLPLSTTERTRREAEAGSPKAAALPAELRVVVSPQPERRVITSSGARRPPALHSKSIPTLKSLHGGPPAAARRQTAKQAKNARDQAAAAKRNITVEELRVQRVAKAREDSALAAEAKALGITTKELRKIRSDGTG